MQYAHEAMQVALRVLNAIRDCQQPVADDVTRLRALAPALPAAPADELACDVICQVLRCRVDYTSDKSLLSPRPL